MLYHNFRIFFQSKICPNVRGRTFRGFYTCQTLYETEKRGTNTEKLVLSTSKNDGVGVPLGSKVKDAGKTVWYTGIVVIGFLATGALLFAVIKELLWSESPQSVYSDALKKCTECSRMKDLLGEPITGFCDGSGRRGRTNLRHSFYVKDGVEHLQIRFYVKGIRNQATVNAVMEKTTGKFEYKYLVAETENYPKEKIFLIDNRKYGVNLQEC
ncbi:mitochondrial import inner membrane translocase subunit Tim21-like [Daphnia carinata]|uniref:mitochondrial import inner membrane translocase subunit Tim21-like n=1 Tax=Daphnia carinata TaxID=120202 RepID=UPI002580B8D9|nr:mitochondrial import inner membrane translocase subunit Tim21-like [Daphnia carinata]